MVTLEDCDSGGGDDNLLQDTPEGHTTASMLERVLSTMTETSGSINYTMDDLVMIGIYSL